MPEYSGAGSSDGFPWFALRVRSNFERITAVSLRNQGYAEFLPQYKTRRKMSDRFKTIDRPLFPGYVFSRFDPNNRLPILTTPGVVQIVGIRNTPVAVDSSEIEAIDAIVKSGLPTEPCPFLQIGDRILIEEGPLSGLEGILVEVTKRYRLIATITLLQRSIAVEIDPGWVRSVPPKRSVSHG